MRISERRVEINHISKVHMHRIEWDEEADPKGQLLCL